MDFLDRLAGLPSFAKIKQGDSIDSWREFPKDGGKGHLLMRPLGQLILAEAIGRLSRHDNGPKIPLDLVFTKIRKYDAQGGFENVDSPKSVWYGITYNPHRQTMSMDGKSAAVLLLMQMIGGLDSLTTDEQAELLEKFRDFRTFDNPEGKPRTADGKSAHNHDGKVVLPTDVQLPPMI